MAYQLSLGSHLPKSTSDSHCRSTAYKRYNVEWLIRHYSKIATKKLVDFSFGSNSYRSYRPTPDDCLLNRQPGAGASIWASSFFAASGWTRCRHSAVQKWRYCQCGPSRSLSVPYMQRLIRCQGVVLITYDLGPTLSISGILPPLLRQLGKQNCDLVVRAMVTRHHVGFTTLELRCDRFWFVLAWEKQFVPTAFSQD